MTAASAAEAATADLGLAVEQTEVASAVSEALEALVDDSETPVLSVAEEAVPAEGGPEEIWSRHTNIRIANLRMQGRSQW